MDADPQILQTVGCLLYRIIRFIDIESVLHMGNLTIAVLLSQIFLAKTTKVQDPSTIHKTCLRPAKVCHQQSQ